MADLTTATTLLYSEGSVYQFSIYSVTGATSNAADTIVLTTAFSSITAASQLRLSATPDISTADFGQCTISGTTVTLTTVVAASKLVVFAWGNAR